MTRIRSPFIVFNKQELLRVFSCHQNTSVFDNNSKEVRFILLTEMTSENEAHLSVSRNALHFSDRNDIRNRSAFVVTDHNYTQ